MQHTGRFLWAFGIVGAYLIVGVLAYSFLLGRIEVIDAVNALEV